MRIGKIAVAATLIAAISGLPALALAYNATQAVTANIAFDTPLTITKNADIQFGTVKAAQAGTYVISTAGVITASGGGLWLYGTPAAGNLTIAGSSTQTITVSTGTYTANGGITPSAATCKYASGSETACDSGISVAAPGTGTTLLLGVQLVSDGLSQVANTAATPGFTVTVVYN